MDYAAARQEMVEAQLVRRGITDERVLDTFRRVAREEFVPQNLRQSAYEDSPLPIGERQTISQPYMVALMTQCLNLEGNEKILEIGTGSGYQAAILSRLVSGVYTIERDPFLARFARRNLERVGIKNVEVITGDGWLGHPRERPYDKIIAACAVPEISKHWVEQLKDNGIITAPVGSSWFQELTLGRKIQGKLKTKNYGGCAFVPLRR